VSWSPNSKGGGRHSQFEQPATRICDLLLGPPPVRVWLADRLDEATGQLRAELATQREAKAKLEALWSLIVRVRDLVLGGAVGLSLLAMSMSIVAELLKSRIDTAAS
jgi:hypothetical protein